jgi:hypothetical protein
MSRARKATLELRVLRLQREGKRCNRCALLEPCHSLRRLKLLHMLRANVCADFCTNLDQRVASLYDDIQELRDVQD